MSSIFISYTTRDAEGDVWADQLVAWCEEWQYGYFRDKDRSRGVVAGENWRASLHQQLGLAQIVISLCSPSYESSSWCVWELAAAVERGKRVIPVQLGEKQVPNLVQNRQVLVIEQAVNPSEDLLEEMKHRLHRALKEQLDWRALQPWDRSLPPYPGLPAFEAAQAPVFFGRDAAVDTVRERLASLAQRSPAFLLLLGASGTGKSSLVRAGVLPRLQADGGRWQLLAPFTPGPMPFLRLAKVVMEAWASFEQLPPSKELGERDEDTLLRQLQYLHAIANAPVLLVVDQFEELLVEQQPEAERFLQFLQELLQLELCGVVLLATLRSDFLELLQNRWPKLVGMSTTLPVQPIQPEDFGELILGPAQRSGLTLQPGLQERLVKDSGGRDALPLLAFTLEKLWQKRQERGKPVEGANGSCYDLTVADYQALGGVSGSVSSQAALCWDLLTSNSVDTAALRDAFLYHLVRLNEEDLASKQTARWEDLPERSKPLLRRFVKARLLVSRGEPEGDVLEIAHDALLRTWEPLKRWIEDGRLELEQRRRILRLCDDLDLKETLDSRLAALQSLLVLAEADRQQAVAAGAFVAPILLENGRSPQEWLVAIRFLRLVDRDTSVMALSAFLKKQQVRELTDVDCAAPVVEALCLAATYLQAIHSTNPTCSEDIDQWLLMPRAILNDDGRALLTNLVRLRLWAEPRIDVPSAWFEPLCDEIAITMVAIPAGSFLMGTSLDEEQNSEYIYHYQHTQGPQHVVSLREFWISQAPVTQAQWQQVMGSRNCSFTSDQAKCEQRPMESVSWFEALAFCRRLSDSTGRNYTLPSEAQWEYACRAGTTSRFHVGNIMIDKLANYDARRSCFGERDGGYLGQTKPVGQFPANPWGLQDMHGNVSEYCMDSWHTSYEGAPSDGNPWIDLKSMKSFGMHEDKLVVVRGGSWSSVSLECRSDFRRSCLASKRFSDVGFRVVCTPGYVSNDTMAMSQLVLSIHSP